MAFRPNYNQQRGDRNRAKDQKKQERLQRRDELSQKRKVERGDEPATEQDPQAAEPEEPVVPRVD